ncbi:ATP-binding protein [Actinoplanes sp. NPDC051633]|uniref:ATP-binding protein n=1 Tax=Actinoplanes sp. NPDC051633 TaxID=3155670 RepID=UPI00342C2089
MTTHLRPAGPIPAPVRPAQPPFLVTTGTDRRALSVGVVADASGAVIEMTVHGRWSQQLAAKAAATLQLCLAGPTASIIVDLHSLADSNGMSRPFWVAVERTARLGPAPFRLALCLTPKTMLDNRLRHSEAHRPLMFATMPEARQAIAERLPHPRRVQTRLAPQPESVPVAREIVARACRTWRLSELRDDAILVMSELVANAVRHARTDLVVTVSSNGSLMHLAVRDGDTRFPRLLDPGPDGGASAVDEREHGLRLVHSVAAAWGAMPARGGKVVWATVSPGTPERETGSTEPGSSVPPGLDRAAGDHITSHRF